MSSEWTDELRQEVVNKYLKANPTPENTSEIVKEIAEEMEKTPNGVRMILMKAEVYVSKAISANKSSNGEKKSSNRVSKADSLDALHSAIEAAGQEVDEEITSKLTGKAAVYFTDIINNLGK